MTLTAVSWIALALGLATAAAVALDVYRHPQPMRVMNVTWPITGLYFPVVGWWCYVVMGRTDATAGSSHRAHAHADTDRSGDSEHVHHHVPRPKWQSVFVGVTHCGGCTLGDAFAAPIVAATGFAMFGSERLGHYTGAFVGAYVFGLAFQILPALEMGETRLARAFVNAVKADTLSPVAFEIGMFGWLTLAFLGFMNGAPPVASAEYWFMMQIAMIVGFVTAYPANWWLIGRGIKHGM